MATGKRTEPVRHDIAEAWQEPTPQAGLLDYLLVLRRHIGLILGLFAVALLVATAVALVQPKMYTGKLTMQVQADPPDYVPSVKDVTSSADAETFYTTQLGILRSRAVAERVAESLAPDQRQALVAAPGGVTTLLSRLGLPQGGASSDGANADEPSREAVVNAVRRHLTVFRRKDSELVEVQYTAPQPELAAHVANQIARGYRQVEANQRVEVSEQVRNWLSGQLEQLRKDLAESEQAVQAYKRKHDLLDTDSVEKLSETRLSGTSEALLDARAERMRAEVRYEQVQQAEDLDSLVAVLGNPVIQQLKMQQSTLRAEVERLGTHYGANAPKMQEARAELQSITSRLRTEVDRAVASIKKQYQEAKQAEQRLEQAHEQVGEQVREGTGETLQLAKLEREVETNRQLYEAFRNRMKEISVAGGMGATGVRLVDQAVPPDSPSQPNYTRIFGIAGVLSLAAGIGLAFLSDNLRRTFRTPQALEDRYRLRGLGVMPKVESAQRATLPRLAVVDPDSEFTQAMGAIRTRLQLTGTEGGPQVLIVTSAIQGEGKSTLSSNLASSYAQLQRTLLIDADLRRASLSSQWHGSGLTDFVLAGAELERCVGQDNLSPELFVMGKGQTPVHPQDFFARPEFGRALATLRSRFQRIIIDTAPVLSVSDVEIMGRLADGALLAVRAGHTRTDAVNEALRRLRSAQIPVLGVTLTQADMKELVRYGGYAYGYGVS